MVKSTVSMSGDFRRRLNSLEYTRKKAGYLFSKNLITRRDIEQIYQGLFLEAVAAFERFIEDLFLGLLSKKIIPHSLKTSPKVFFSSRVIAEPIVFGGKYCDWFPYFKTEARANSFFNQGHPFKALDNNDSKKIEEFLIIRNVIAHQSTHAKRQFENKVIGSTALSPRERRVGYYLTGNIRTSPVQTRYENLIIDMAFIFDKICRS